MKLSIHQEAIRNEFRKGIRNIAVKARAGSGKTTTIVMLGEDVTNEDAIFLAFNVHNVKSINEKLAAKGSSMIAKTIHSLGRAALVKNGVKNLKADDYKYLELAKDFVYSKPGIYANDEDQQQAYFGLKDLVNMCRLNLVDTTDVKAVENCADNYGIFCDSEIAHGVDSVIRKGVSAEYISKKGIDFIDMIFMPVYFNWKVQQYSLIFGDEVQDWNDAMIKLLQMSLKPSGRVVLVGDPDQAIMGFAGANTNSFQIVSEAFNCVELPLNFCYRCGSSIVEKAQSIVPEIASPEGQHSGIVDTIPADKIFQQAKDGDAIICRKTAPLVGLCLAFIAQGITARVRGRNIATGIVVHAKKAAKLGDWEDFPESVKLYRERESFKMRKLGKGEAAIENFEDTCDCLEVIYQPTMRNVRELEGAIMGLFDERNIGIMLSTVHRAKGLEWDRVFIYKPEFLPLVRKGQSAEQRRQEMNLTYVAITRAKNHLTFVLS